MRRLLLIAGLLLAAPLSAKDFDRSAAAAAKDGLDAVTVFVDADWGSRGQGAAKDLNRAHASFAKHGYELLDVELYDENGDLQGFFVSYRRRTP